MSDRHGFSRALLLVFWSLVVWGSVYSLALLRVALVEGPTAAFRQALAGRDTVGGLGNLGLALLALLTWSLLGLALWHARRRGRPAPTAAGSGPGPADRRGTPLR